MRRHSWRLLRGALPGFMRLQYTTTSRSAFILGMPTTTPTQRTRKRMMSTKEEEEETPLYYESSRKRASIVADVVQTREREGAHVPVMPEEVMKLWVNSDRVAESMETGEALHFIDATAGHGGHTEMLLRLHPNAKVLCIERDPQALAKARKYIAQSQHGEDVIQRVYFYNGSFSNLERAIEATGFPTRRMDGILFDFGLNSAHIDSAERGFSYRQDSILDMRYNASAAKNETPPAQDLLERIDYNGLQALLKERGEIHDFPEEIAAAIIRWRGKGSKRRKIRSTLELRFVVEQALEQVLSKQRKTSRRSLRKHYFTVNSNSSLFPEKASHWNSKIKREKELSRLKKLKPKYPLTVQKVFQALRLAVNDEEYHLVQALSRCPRVLAPHGGRLACISFSPHEDAFVQNLFNVLNVEETSWKELTANVSGGDTIGSSQAETASYLRPRRAEVRHNSRARSAHLRCIEKTASSAYDQQDINLEAIGLTAIPFASVHPRVDNNETSFNTSVESWSEDEDHLINQLRKDMSEEKIRFVLEPEYSEAEVHTEKVGHGERGNSLERMMNGSNGKRLFSTNNGDNDKDTGVLDSIIDDTIDNSEQKDAPVANDEDIQRLKEVLDQSEGLREQYQSMIGKSDIDMDEHTEENMRQFGRKIGIDLNQPDLDKLNRILRATGVPDHKQQEAWDSASQEIMGILRRRAKSELGLGSNSFDQLLKSLNNSKSSAEAAELLNALEMETSSTNSEDFNSRENRENARILAGKLANVDPPSPTELEEELPYMQKVMSEGENMELPRAFTEAGITLDNIHQFSEEKIESVLNSIDPEDDDFSGISWEDAISLEEQGKPVKPQKPSPKDDDSALHWEWDAEEDETWRQEKSKAQRENQKSRQS